MGLFSNLFSKKEHGSSTTAARTDARRKKPRYIVKSQRFILDNVKDHMEDIMDLVEKNEDYKLKKKDLIEENREDENIYEYELNEKATITPISCEGGVEQLQVFVCNTHIGDIKKGGISRVKNLLKKGNIENIWSEVSGGNYKHLRYDAGKDVYYYDELEKEFSITIEITYKEEITE